MNRCHRAVLCLVLFSILLSGFGICEAKKEKKTPPGQLKKQEKAAGKKSGESLGSGDSVSRTKLKGWFRIHVVGTGKKCLVKEKDKTKTEKEQFGDFASSEAFIDFFGEPQCEAGDKGNAKAKIRASVVAEAYAIGPECLSKVLASVMEAETKTHKVHRDVTVEVSAEAGGDALALCEVQY